MFCVLCELPSSLYRSREWRMYRGSVQKWRTPPHWSWWHALAVSGLMWRMLGYFRFSEYTTFPLILSLGVASFLGPFVYARLISQSRGLYRIELGVEASSQYGCSAARVLAPHWRLDIAVNSSDMARTPIILGVVDQKALILLPSI